MNKKSWDEVCKFHGHVCPGIAIGYKAVEALEQLGFYDFSKDEEIVCITENDACGVDAIQYILGCTFGKGNLIYKPLGKMAYNFYFRNSNKAIRLYLLDNSSKEKLSREEWLNYVLKLNAKDMFKVSIPTLKLPENARLFNSVKCENCGEFVREDKIRLQNGKKVCLSCFNEYDR